MDVSPNSENVKLILLQQIESDIVRLRGWLEEALYRRNQILAELNGRPKYHTVFTKRESQLAEKTVKLASKVIAHNMINTCTQTQEQYFQQEVNGSNNEPKEEVEYESYEALDGEDLGLSPIKSEIEDEDYGEIEILDEELNNVEELCKSKPKKEEPKKESENIFHESRSFTCNSCDILFVSELDYFAHFKKCNPMGLLRCYLCLNYFPSIELLKDHLSKNHRTAFNHRKKCVVCFKEFASANRLKLHLLKHQPTKRFPCCLCGESFSSRKDRARHTKWFHRDSVIPLKCEKCTRVFTHADDLKLHRDHAHRDKIKCAFCGEVFNTRALVEQHIFGVHLKERQCGICSVVCESDRDLEMHGELHKAEKGRSVCATCGLLCVDQKELAKHISTMHREEKINNTFVKMKVEVMKCEVCGIEFEDESVLKEHLAQAHPPACHICERQCVTIVEFLEHLNEHFYVQNDDEEMVIERLDDDESGIVGEFVNELTMPIIND